MNRLSKYPLFHVKKRTLLAVAGCVWLAAGVNIARLGILSYQQLASVTVIQILFSLVVFCLFGMIFFKMSRRHVKRIDGYEEETRPVWHFFDWKAYIIMVVMMGGGIWLRSSGLVPDVFIAVFYTGLGCALAMAGLFFGITFFRYEE